MNLSICRLENEAILRDPLNVRSWQRQKRKKSARPLQFSNSTTSKTKQFRETSWIIEVDSIKNEAALGDFLQKWKVECRADGLVPMRFAICPLHLSKIRKMRPGHTKCRTCHAKSSQQTWRSDAPKMQPLSGNDRRDLLTSLMNMSLVLRLPRKMHLCRSSSNVPRLPTLLKLLQNPHVLLTLDKVHVQRWSERTCLEMWRF